MKFSVLSFLYLLNLLTCIIKKRSPASSLRSGNFDIKSEPRELIFTIQCNARRICRIKSWIPYVIAKMWYAALVRFVRRRLVLGIIFASSLTYCIVSFLKEVSILDIILLLICNGAMLFKINEERRKALKFHLGDWWQKCSSPHGAGCNRMSWYLNWFVFNFRATIDMYTMTLF